MTPAFGSILIAPLYGEMLNTSAPVPTEKRLVTMQERMPIVGVGEKPRETLGLVFHYASHRRVGLPNACSHGPIPTLSLRKATAYAV